MWGKKKKKVVPMTLKKIKSNQEYVFKYIHRKINKSKQQRSLASEGIAAGKQETKAADGSNILKLSQLFLQPTAVY